MTANLERVPSFSFEDAERAQLLAWISLSAGAKIDFFEEMVELAYQSGALSPERLALRDGAPNTPPTSRFR
ncbi:hypothetical protein H2514_05455 [Lysobacter sp. CW239]|nr:MULTISPECIES: hypothetical protein [Lysobacter]QOD92072.1 hypothetical protein H2514_05455 [Lysobacter sp. CW239]